MKIEKLDIKNLHNHYNYHVEFNNDLTFLYGSNGCGKTTILNIIEAIVSGRIYELYALEFDRIRLTYYDDERKEYLRKTININHAGDDNIQINWDGVTRMIKRDDFNRSCEEADSFEELYNSLEIKFPILMEIRNEFNYVYLPLNRASNSNINSIIYGKYGRLNRSRLYFDNWETRYPYREARIGRTTELVQKKYAEASAQVAKINNDFRNNVLRSLLTTDVKKDEDLLTFLLNPSIISETDQIHGDYFKLLASLGLLNEREREKFDNFFNEYKEQIRKFSMQSRGDNSFSVPFSLIYQYHEIEKIRTLIPLAQIMEEYKAKAMARINLFENTMNAFIHETDNDKQLYIDETGKIRFRIGDIEETNISMNNLSSGEKQLLIFFANLIFNVDEEKPSIFVVDEPELSLHLNWQRMFIEKAASINGNMQLIFATHAPEIVGKYRNKMYKLIKRTN